MQQSIDLVASRFEVGGSRMPALGTADAAEEESMNRGSPAQVVVGRMREQPARLVWPKPGPEFGEALLDGKFKANVF